MSGFAFDLVTPDRLLVSRSVTMVTVPGEEGDFGALAGHAPLVSGVRTGTITIHDDGVITDRYFVAGGFAEVTPERCTVLAEIAIPFSEMTREGLETEATRLREVLSVTEDEAARLKLERQAALNAAKLTALQQTSAH